MTNSFYFLASTVLFVDSHPIGYKVYKADGSFRLEPTDIPDDSFNPPYLFVEHHGDEWNVCGTTDQDLIDQVIEDLCSIDNRPVIEKAAPLRTALS